MVHYIISEEALKELSLKLGTGATTTNNPQTAGFKFGTTEAIKQVKESAIEIDEDQFDAVQELLDRVEGEKGNGGFANAGE